MLCHFVQQLRAAYGITRPMGQVVSPSSKCRSSCVTKAKDSEPPNILLFLVQLHQALPVVYQASQACTRARKVLAGLWNL
jgi:hypothetical protein